MNIKQRIDRIADTLDQRRLVELMAVESQDGGAVDVLLDDLREMALFAAGEISRVGREAAWTTLSAYGRIAVQMFVDDDMPGGLAALHAAAQEAEKHTVWTERVIPRSKRLIGWWTPLVDADERAHPRRPAVCPCGSCEAARAREAVWQVEHAEMVSSSYSGRVLAHSIGR